MPRLNPQTHIDRATQCIDEALAVSKSPGFKGLTDEGVDSLLKIQVQVRHLRDSHIRLLRASHVPIKKIAAMYHLTSARISQICADEE